MNNLSGLAWMLALAIAIIAGSILINWVTFEIFRGAASRLGGEWDKSPGLTLIAPAITAAVVNISVWILIFSLLF